MTTVRPDQARARALRDAAVEPLPVVSIHGPVALGRFAAPADGGSELVVRDVLGTGGMGRVLLGRQRSLGRDVAIKMLHDARGERDSLVREARIVGALEHPNVVPVHLLAQSEGGEAVFVMKRIEGVRWLDLVREPEHPHWERVPGGDDRALAHLEIFSSVCNAVALAHERGIVHRDIKPENVMIGSFGEVYLTDWGIALDLAGDKIEEGAPFAGTPSYAAPEMLAGDERIIDSRTDVYLLGATLHHVLTGRPRHDGDDVYQALGSASVSDPCTYGPDVPSELGALVNAATHRSPDARPISALALRDAVQRHVRHRGAQSLLDRARARLDTLETAKDPDRAMIEIRLALEEAVRVWPTSELADALFVRSRRAFFRVEHARGNAGAARAALDELVRHGAPVDDERTSLDALERSDAEREAREKKLADIEREQDLGVSVGARRGLLLLLVVTIACMGITIVAGRLIAGYDVLVQGPVIAAVVASAGFAAVVFAMRRSLLANRANRNVVASVGAGVAFLLVHRGIGLAMGLTVPQVVAMDIAGIGSLVALASALAFPRLWPGAAAFLAGAVLAVLHPSGGIVGFVLGMIVTSLVALRAWSRP